MNREELVIRSITDIIHYDVELKEAMFIYNGQIYSAAVAFNGSETIPRPDMFSAIWIGPSRIHPLNVDIEYDESTKQPKGLRTGQRFQRQFSVLILFPKSLTIQAQSATDVSSSLLFGVPSQVSQKQGAFFSGIYMDDGTSVGTFIDNEGNLILKAVKGSIVIGKDGITINGEVSNIEGRRKGGLVMTENPIAQFIPSTVVTPFPNEIPDIAFLDQIKRQLVVPFT